MKRIVGIGLAIATALLPTWLRASGAAESADLQVFRPGVTNSRTRPISSKQMQILVKGLCRWTGFEDLDFDNSEALRTGDRARFSGGSATARALIEAAIDSPDQFILENHDWSGEVAFAAIRASACYVDGSRTRHDVWTVKLDFKDFARIRGTGEPLVLFDPAINLLHELAHGVLRLSDPVDRNDSLGACERRINWIRRELGLPERSSYEPEKRLMVTPYSTEQRVVAELAFVKTEPGRGLRTTLLLFDAEAVGDIRGGDGRSATRAAVREQTVAKAAPIRLPWGAISIPASN